MTQRRRNVLMWALYALLFLAVLLLQDCILGKFRIFKASFCLIPLLTCAVAVHTGPEEGGIFALIVGVVWALSGATDGGLMIFLMTFSAVVAGYLCGNVFGNWLLPASGVCLVGYALCLLVHYGIRIYLLEMHVESFVTLLVQLLLALPFAPLFVWCCQAIRKAGP